MPTFYPAASSDDAKQSESDGSVVINGTTLRIDGMNSVGLRFPNVTIPKNTTIARAILKAKYVNYTGTGNLTQTQMRGYAVDNMAVFAATPNNLVRSLTTANKGFNTIPADSTIETVGIDVTAIVQEIINRAGWVSGNALGLAFLGTGDTAGSFLEIYAWDYFSGNQRASLEISSTEVGSAAFSGSGSLSASPILDLMLSATFEGGSATAGSLAGTFNTFAAFSGSSGMIAAGVPYIPNEDLDRKYFTYKVYSPSNEYIGELNNVITDFHYTQEVNSLGFEIEIELAQTADNLTVLPKNLATQVPEDITTESTIEIAAFTDSNSSFGSGSLIAVLNRIEVWVAYGRIDTLTMQTDEDIEDQSGSAIDIDIGSPNGRKLFTGYISGYTPRYGREDTTLVNVKTFGNQLNQNLIANGNATTVSYNGSSPSAMLKDILDKAAALGLVPTYSPVSIQNSRNSSDFTFRVDTIAQGVQKAHELSPSDWIWFYDTATNLVWLRDLPTSPDHTFVLGKHYTDLNLKYTTDDVVNEVHFVGGEVTPGNVLYKKYSDASSIANFGKGLRVITDDRVTLESSADLLAQNEIERYKNPIYLGSVTISAGVYSIEDIRLGDLVAFRGHGNAIDDLQLRVLAEEYNIDTKTLIVGTVLPKVSRSVSDLKQSLEVVSTSGVPTTPS